MMSSGACRIISPTASARKASVFVGVASDGLKWVVFERKGGELVKLKETTLDPDKGSVFLAWLDGAIALKFHCRPNR